MARKRKRSILDSEFARPIGALILLGLLWLAFKSGLLLWLTTNLMSLLKPH